MEPVVIELTSPVNFDGSTAITLTRRDLTVTGQRYYSGALPAGGGGVIQGDLFGLFQRQAVKLVGVSGLYHNGLGTLKVVTPYASGRIRQEVDITPTVQYVLVYPDDNLVIRTAEPTSTIAVSLVANELTEANHLAYALSLTHENPRRRFRVYRAAGETFEATTTVWNPTWTYAPTKGVLYSTSTDRGVIPCSSLSLEGNEENFYVRVRFAGIDAATGELAIAERSVPDVQVVQSGLNSMEWSKVFVVGYHDHIGFNGEAPGAGGAIGVEIEVVHVRPGDHLAKRHDINLAELGGGEVGIDVFEAETAVAARTVLGTNKEYIPLRVNTLVGTGVSRVISKYAGTLSLIDTIIEGSLAVAAATLTAKINGVAVTTGVVEIAQAGSAAGDKDSATPTGANTVAVGDELSLTCGGGNTTATVANAWFEITRT